MKEMMQTSLGRFRLTGIAEGISLLLLLFIAMPLKYFAGRPEAVQLIGWMHGILFVAFMFAILVVLLQRKLPFRYAVLAVFASLVPFGTFYFDRLLKRKSI
jgi:integral membrane protein